MNKKERNKKREKEIGFITGKAKNKREEETTKRERFLQEKNKTTKQTKLEKLDNLR